MLRMISKNFLAKLHHAFTQDTLSSITSCFIVVMFGLFPSLWGSGGYTNITFTKYCCLLICSGLYLLVLLVYLLVKLCRSLEGLSNDELQAKVEQVQGMLSKLAGAKETVSGIVSHVKNFFAAIGDFFSNLFGK